MDKLQYFLETHAHIHENIKLADSKALVIIAINSGIIAGLNLLGIFDKGRPELLAIGVVAFLFVAGAVILSVFVVKPRVEVVSEGLGLSDPIKIARYTNCEKYIADIQKGNDERLLNDLATLIYDRSEINRRKYHWLIRVVYISLVGWLISSVTVFIRIFL
jgi:PHP family Zn ribbon phosphoesterase